MPRLTVLVAVTPIPVPLDSRVVGKRAGKMLMVSGSQKHLSTYQDSEAYHGRQARGGEVGRVMGKWKTKDAGEQERVGKEARIRALSSYLCLHGQKRLQEKFL